MKRIISGRDSKYFTRQSLFQAVLKNLQGFYAYVDVTVDHDQDEGRMAGG